MPTIFLTHDLGVQVFPHDRITEPICEGDELETDLGTYVVTEIDHTDDVRVVELHLLNHPPEPTMNEKKPSNPKDAIGISKAPMSVVPAPFTHAVGLALMEGALKYGRHNYRAVGVRFSVYYDAALRHLNAWWEGEDDDPDSGLPHPIKAAACMAVLFDSMLQGNATDDRPPKSPDGWLREMNEHAKKLLERFPDPLPPITEK